jgi:hypothetical protein
LEEKIPQSFWAGHSEREVLAELYHELDQPILNAKGYAHILAQENSFSDEQKQRMAQHILESVEFLSSLKAALGDYLQSTSYSP